MVYTRKRVDTCRHINACALFFLTHTKHTSTTTTAHYVIVAKTRTCTKISLIKKDHLNKKHGTAVASK